VYFDRTIDRAWRCRLGAALSRSSRHFAVHSIYYSPLIPIPAGLWSVGCCLACRFSSECGKSGNKLSKIVLLCVDSVLFGFYSNLHPNYLKFNYSELSLSHIQPCEFRVVPTQHYEPDHKNNSCAQKMLLSDVLHMHTALQKVIYI
jgi:hypothetical protein